MEGFCTGGGVAAGVCGGVAGRGVAGRGVAGRGVAGRGLGAVAGTALCGMAGVGAAAGFGATGAVAAGGWVGVVAGAGFGVGCADPTGVDGDIGVLINALLLCFYMRPVQRTATAILGHGLCQSSLVSTNCLSRWTLAWNRSRHHRRGSPLKSAV